MPPPTKPQYHLDLGGLAQMNQTPNRSGASSAASSPIEQPPTARLPQSEGGALGGINTSAAGRRGSPSNEHTGSRFYPRRARELQQSEGVTRPMWGPPTASGLSTPLRETIPESPGDDTFPDIGTNAESTGRERAGSMRRGRAGTLPSQFPGVGQSAPASSTASAQQTSARSSARPTPSTSPFRPASNSITGGVSRSNSAASAAASKSALLSRIRAGSMPQRPSLLSNSSNPFGSSLFSTNWIANRDRANTHLGTPQSKDPGSPNSAFQRDFSDTDVKTLDYLGLVDPPQNKMSDPYSPVTYMPPVQPVSGIPQPLLANFANMNRSNRFRSYSVNAKEKYAAEEEDGLDYGAGGFYSGTITPSAEYAAAALAATQAEIHQHNLDVQAFANQASSSRPRARTAGVLDKPSARMWRSVGAPLGQVTDRDYPGLSDAVQAMQLGRVGKTSSMGDYDGDTVAEATRALWLGGIPTSTTPSSLKAIFDPFGRIESARVLTHKSCGFVNFESVESASRARAHFNGKEIFPGAGPVRIGYAKAPSAAGTPSHNSHHPSPSPDPFTHSVSSRMGSSGHDQYTTTHPRSFTLNVPELRDIKSDILAVVLDLGATEEDQAKIAAMLDEASSFDAYESEIPPVPEANHNRIFDAPRLREIRKKIDNNSMSPMEVEETAVAMLPEIGELSSDYLGNTVVQKLFEFSSEQVKEAMLAEVSPRLAEIGVHKNGTWAAQKIIDVARTPSQMSLIIDYLRPYSMASFLDQYGNYVMQCALRFGAPWNNFVFEVMLNRLWTIAQGRFGARAMRACLESHHATKDQQRMLAATVAMHSVHLATNANGALLLTWFLDTCNFPHRRRVLAPRLVPHLVHLCTHKVAYLTVLKLINQRNEPEARDIILQALFFSPDDQVLEKILQDQTCGAMLIFKIITTPFLDDNLRNNISENVRKVLMKIKAQPNQGYKRLMDEVGLSTRGALGRDSSRGPANDPSAQHGANAAFIANQPFPLNTSMTGQRAPSVDSNMGFDPVSASSPGGMNGSMFSSNMGMPRSSPMTPQSAISYQQAMMASGQSPVGYNLNGSGPPAYPPPGLPAMGMGRGGVPNQGQYTSPGGYRSNNGFNGSPGGGMGTFQYPGFGGVPQMQSNQRGRQR